MITHDPRHFYLDGAWAEPAGTTTLAVSNPANGRTIATISLGTAADVERAVGAARAAFDSWSATGIGERAAMLERIIAVYQTRMDDIARTISREMGAPISIARGSHAEQGLGHLREALALLRCYPFGHERSGSRVVREAIGVCALITPWNWPMNQIGCKIAPALATGCTMVLKPSELAPLSAHIVAEILHEAGLPRGVFNLVDGLGPEVGEALARHPAVDMISITGSNRAGAAVARAAADSFKRVSQELGGKSACIVLDDADVAAVAHELTLRLMRNSGQSCAALTRLLVPAGMQHLAQDAARAAVGEIVIGDPSLPETMLGPVVSEAQYRRIQGFIASGIEQGATLIAGGPGKPEGFENGAWVRPTVFADVSSEMTIAQEEIFGPVLCIMPYRDERDALRIANGTRYGLSGMVRSADAQRALRIAQCMRTGMVHINETKPDYGAPFGGYRHSGNGREWGEWGFGEFLETKVIFGAPPVQADF